MVLQYDTDNEMSDVYGFVDAYRLARREQLRQSVNQSRRYSREKAEGEGEEADDLSH
jgi:hypothetical protein